MKNILKKTKILNILVLLTTICFICNPLLALSSDWIINDKSKVRLISSKTSSDNMDEIIIGLEYQLDPGWKTYWKSPGGGGFPQNIIWNNSTNINEIKIEWPTPKEFEILGLTSLGYEERVIFPLIIKLKDKKKLTYININTNYLVCETICIPGNANLFLEIKPGKANYTEFFYELEKSISALPIEDIALSSIYNFKTKVFKKFDEININISAETNTGFINPDVFIHTPFGLPVVKPINNYSYNLKKLSSSFTFNANQFANNSFPIEVIIKDKNHNFRFIKDITIEENLPQVNNSLFYVFLISLLGGFILNLMPCVFPVLSIKLLSVINNQSSNIRLSFIYTAIGIISSFFLLAVFFLLLKQIGVSIAWGMQFQEPYFLLFILLILTIFCINTFGFFEIELPNFLKNNRIYSLGDNFFTKNFFNGFFATLLATPCTAPFVGSAITIAFTQTSTILFSIFIMMGLGMSIPYFLVSIFPSSILLLPKTGKWIVYVKYFLGILLFGTVIWVLNILYNFYNEFFIIAFVIIAITLLLSFKFNFFKFYTSLTAILIISLVPFINFFDQNKDKKFNKDWIDFKNVNIDNMLLNEEIIFVDVTADWCATCQFNKINILDRKNIKNIFKDNDIKLIRADWTKPDKNIDLFLKKFNKFGIPFNAFFSPTFPEGIIMSEILTEKEIIQSLEKIK